MIDACDVPTQSNDCRLSAPTIVFSNVNNVSSKVKLWPSSGVHKPIPKPWLAHGQVQAFRGRLYRWGFGAFVWDPSPSVNLELIQFSFCSFIHSIIISRLLILLLYICISQFALAHWLFLDAAVLSAHYHPPADSPYDSAPVHVTFVDWVPGILSVLGFFIVNLIDKDRIKGEEAYADARAVWRARFILFIGFALMAGGLAGSVVRNYSDNSGNEKIWHKVLH